MPMSGFFFFNLRQAKSGKCQQLKTNRFKIVVTQQGINMVSAPFNKKMMTKSEILN